MGQQFDPEMMRRMGGNGGRNPMGHEGMEGMMPGSGGGMPGGGMPGGGMPGGGMPGGECGGGMPGGGMPGGGMPGGGMPGGGMPGGGMPGGGMPGGGMPGGGMPGGGMPGGMGTPGMKPGEGPAEQEARYRRYEKRRKRQEAEHRDMDLEIDDVINKILTEDVPRNYRPSDYDFKRNQVILTEMKARKRMKMKTTQILPLAMARYLEAISVNQEELQADSMRGCRKAYRSLSKFAKFIKRTTLQS